MAVVPPRLQKDQAALVLIDMQVRFRELVHEMPQVVAACSRLLRFCRRLEIPVLVTEHYPKGLGATLPELRAHLPEAAPLQKITFSCLQDEPFRAALADTGRSQIILCGIETHVCVYQTAYDLLASGHQVVVATDATSSRRSHDRQTALAHLQQLGCQNLSTEMILFEILKVAQTHDFKAVAGILKE